MIEFYGEIVQNLKPLQARAPQLPETPPDEPPPVTPQPEPPPFTATADTDRELGEATTPLGERRESP